MCVMVGFDQWGWQRAILTRGWHTLNGVSLWWVVFTSNGGVEREGHVCVCCDELCSCQILICFL